MIDLFRDTGCRADGPEAIYMPERVETGLIARNSGSPIASSAALGIRENVRRSAGVVLDEFRDYWDGRTEAMHAIPLGRDPRVVRDWLAGHRLTVVDD